MHKFDTFSKPLKEFQVKTKLGGYISILTCVVIATLLISEIFYFLELEQKDEMVVDFAQDAKSFHLHLDMWLPDLPCSLVALNLVHVKNQDNVMHVGHTILKQRWGKEDESGAWKQIGLPIRSGLHRISISAGEFNDNLTRNLGVASVESLPHSTRKQRCMSCYGAHQDEDDCCNSCEDVENAFRERGWQMDPAHKLEQCSQQLFDVNPPMPYEGCKLSTQLIARKVPAYLQIGLAYDFEKNHLHKKFIALASQGYVSFTHTIERLTFGPGFPGFIPVLDGLERKHDHVPLIESWSDQKLESQSEHWQYDLHLIPTDYVNPFGQTTESHQYSSTHYVKGLNVAQRHRDLPAAGIYFKYEFTAFKVRWIQSYKSLTHFLTNICAILGGIYAFFGMIDNFLYHAMRFGDKSCTGLGL